MRFSRDGREEAAEYKRDQEMKNQATSVRSLDLSMFLPGVSDELHPCRCGRRFTMGGTPCGFCKAECRV